MVYFGLWWVGLEIFGRVAVRWLVTGAHELALQEVVLKDNVGERTLGGREDAGSVQGISTPTTLAVTDDTRSARGRLG